MKKVMYLAATAAVMVLASCGGGADKEAERKKREADSLAKIEQARKDSMDAAMAVQTVNVYETAKANPDFSTLVSLLDQAGLSATLQDESVNFTVFAPTNAAFDKLGAKTLEDLKAPKSAEKLKDILLYHVVRGKLMAGDVANSGELQGMDDKVIVVKQSESGTVMVGNAAVTTADVDASNGVIHIVDAVLTPPAKKGTAKTNPPATAPATPEDKKPGTTTQDKVGDKMSGDRTNETTNKVGDKMSGDRTNETTNKVGDKMNRK
ncbi:MAG: fasciclin domain-containing protein [Flavobacteriales bacterium]|nr:fasciclin domain-containing protein [Flavobacteriales bacterium]